MTKSDDVFTCFVEVTANETADFDVSLNTFSELPFVHININRNNKLKADDILVISCRTGAFCAFSYGNLI